MVHVAPLAGLVAPRQTHRRADEGGERLGPRTGDDVRADRTTVEVGDQAIGEHGSVAFGDAAVGERQRQMLVLGVVGRPDGLQWTESVACEQTAGVIHQVEEAVLVHADRTQLDLFRVREGHGFDRSDIHPKDVWHDVSLTDHDSTTACSRVASNGGPA